MVGLTRAFFQIFGKTPVSKEVLIILVANGRICGRYSFSLCDGIGSVAYVVDLEDMMSFFTSSASSSANEVRGVTDRRAVESGVFIVVSVLDVEMETLSSS